MGSILVSNAIDDTGNVDTTGALQTLINNSASGTVIELDNAGLYALSGGITIPNGITVTTQQVASNALGDHAAIWKKLMQPWRVVPEDRTNQPTYYAASRTCQWQFDALGGEANVALPYPNMPQQYGKTSGISSTSNPWMIPNPDAPNYSATTTYPKGAIVVSGSNFYISLAAGNKGNAVTNTTWWAVTYAPWQSGVTYAAGTDVFYGGAMWISLVNGNVGHTPPANPALPNTGFWGIDGNAGYANGAQSGGYDATTGWPPTSFAGGTYDGLHLDAIYGAPWLGVQPGVAIQYLISTTTQINETVTAVSSDGKHIFWGDNSLAQHVASEGTVAWCITRAGCGFKIAFLPDDSQSVYVPPPANHPWNAFITAINQANNLSQQPVVHVLAGGALIGVEVRGPNGQSVESGGAGTRQQAITNFQKSMPLVTELGPLVQVEPGGICELVNAHNGWGDGFGGAGNLTDCFGRSNGRQGTTGHYDNKIILRCVFDDNAHSEIDIEDPVGNPHTGVQIIGPTTIGGHGIAISTPLVNFTIDIQSRQCDLNAGYVSVLSPLVHGHWTIANGTPMSSSNWNVKFDSDYFVSSPPHNSDASIQIGGVVGLTIHDSHKLTDGYFLQPYYKNDESDRCTSITLTACDGGPNSIANGSGAGQIAP